MQNGIKNLLPHSKKITTSCMCIAVNVACSKGTNSTSLAHDKEMHL